MNETMMNGITGNYYSTNSATSYGYSWNLSDFIGKEEKEKIIEKMLEDEDDLMPILKQYLAKYLDDIMENPESIVKELIKEKDDRINKLEKRVEELEKQLEFDRMNDMPFGPQPIPYPPYYPPSDILLGYNNGTITATTGYITTV